MTDTSQPDTMEQVTAWIDDESGFTIDASGDVTVEGDPPLQIGLSVDDERVLLTYVTAEPGAGASRADAVISGFPERGTTLHAAASVDKAGVTFTITNFVYTDGLSRQSFMTALNDIVAAVDTIGTSPAAETKVQEAVEASGSVAEDVTPIVADPAPAGSTWSATHRVPAGGMRAWGDPDPSQQPITRLEPRVELAIAEQRGLWSRVVGSNGWTGWVDTRQLQPLGAAPTGSGEPIAVGGIEIRPIALVGAAGLILAAFLPWVSVFTSVNSLDVALAFLWDLGAAGAPYLGWVIIGLGVIAVVLSSLKQQNQALLLLIGVVALALTGAFLVQMYRGITDSGGSFADIFDWIGVGTWVSLVSSVVLIAGSNK